jgi:hypothetical protein
MREKRNVYSRTDSKRTKQAKRRSIERRQARKLKRGVR